MVCSTEVKVVGNLESKTLSQYIILQENIEDEYVNKEVGFTFKRTFRIGHFGWNDSLKEIYIGNGYQFSHKQKTLEADMPSYSAYLEM